jgi:hypothetical protein
MCQYANVPICQYANYWSTKDFISIYVNYLYSIYFDYIMPDISCILNLIEPTSKDEETLKEK